MAKSGKFMVRMPPAQHAHLAREAKASGSSLNRFVVDVLAKGTGFTPAARRKR